MGSAEQLTRTPIRRRRQHRTAPPGLRAAWAVLVVSTLARAVLVSMVSLAAWSLAPAAFGMTSTTVMSGSMAPVIQPGDVVVARPATPADLRVGAVLLVEDPDHAGRLRLHRVSAVRDGVLQLRGDANPEPDSSPVGAEAVRGVGFLRVPFAGMPLLWARTGEWAPVAAFAAGAAVLMGLARMHRLLPAAPVASGRRRLTGAAPTAALLALVLLTATSAPTDAWAGFTAVTRPPKSTFAAGSFPCLTAPRSPAPSSAAAIEYRFAEVDGTTTQNLGTLGAGGTLFESVDRVPGSCAARGGPAVQLGRTMRGSVVAPNRITSPAALTMAVWFKTSTGGGLLAGFGGSGTADPSGGGAYDRQLTLGTDGSLTFRVLILGGGSSSITAPARKLGGYADGEWHQAVVTLSGALGMSIAVDGVVVIQSLLSLSLTFYQGYFRFGYDAVPGSTTTYYRGLMTGAQVWTGTALGVDDIAAVFAAGH